MAQPPISGQRSSTRLSVTGEESHGGSRRHSIASAEVGVLVCLFACMCVSHQPMSVVEKERQYFYANAVTSAKWQSSMHCARSMNKQRHSARERCKESQLHVSMYIINCYSSK